MSAFTTQNDPHHSVTSSNTKNITFCGFISTWCAGLILILLLPHAHLASPTPLLVMWLGTHDRSVLIKPEEVSWFPSHWQRYNLTIMTVRVKQSPSLSEESAFCVYIRPLIADTDSLLPNEQDAVSAFSVRVVSFPIKTPIHFWERNALHKEHSITSPILIHKTHIWARNNCFS